MTLAGLVIAWAVSEAPYRRTECFAAFQTPASAPVASQPGTMPAGYGLYVQGRARRLAGEAAAAIRLLRQAVQHAPDNIDYVSELAQAHALRQDWAAVEKLLSPFRDRLGVAGLLLLADACVRTQQPARAARVLEHGLRERPDDERLWLALIDQTLSRRQCASALEQVSRAERHLGTAPRLRFRAAQAYYHLGQALGQTRVIRVADGRAGQFSGAWLLIEKHEEPDRFLACPPESALYALRRALDAGLDEPAAHLLHARIWHQAGRHKIALAILQSHEARWLEGASTETLATFGEVALAANALDDFLRYAQLRADREPRQRTGILFDAFTAAAERYNQRGNPTMSRELLRRALSLKPDNVKVMLQLADAVWDTGGRKEAATWYRRVLEREPGHPERRRILERLEE